MPSKKSSRRRTPSTDSSQSRSSRSRIKRQQSKKRRESSSRSISEETASSRSSGSVDVKDSRRSSRRGADDRYHSYKTEVRSRVGSYSSSVANASGVSLRSGPVGHEVAGGQYLGRDSKYGSASMYQVRVRNNMV